VKPEQALYGASFVNLVASFLSLCGDSSVRPEPRAFFRSDRRSALAVARSGAVKDGASSAPPKACPWGDASTAARY